MVVAVFFRSGVVVVVSGRLRLLCDGRRRRCGFVGAVQQLDAISLDHRGHLLSQDKVVHLLPGGSPQVPAHSASVGRSFVPKAAGPARPSKGRFFLGLGIVRRHGDSVTVGRFVPSSDSSRISKVFLKGPSPQPKGVLIPMKSNEDLCSAMLSFASAKDIEIHIYRPNSTLSYYPF